MEEKKELFSKRVPAGSRTYFFDVKETRTGDKYLVISESRATKPGKHEHSRIMIFTEYITKFTQALQEAVKFITGS